MCSQLWSMNAGLYIVHVCIHLIAWAEFCVHKACVCSSGTAYGPWVCVQVIDTMKVNPQLGKRDLKRPSVSFGSSNLYMHGPLEEMTRPNLRKVSCLHAMLAMPSIGASSIPCPPISCIAVGVWMDGVILRQQAAEHAADVLRSASAHASSQEAPSGAPSGLSISMSLLQTMSSLVDGSGSIIQLNDPSLVAPLRVSLKFTDDIAS